MLNEKYGRIICGDTLAELPKLPDASVHCAITSPPYFNLRSYLPDGHPDKHKEVGLENTPEQYVEKMVRVFREVRRVLRDDATCWINIGDTYAGTGGGSASWSTPLEQKKKRGEGRLSAVKREPCGLPQKNLIGIPWRLAFALQADGWILRQDIIWEKPAPMPGSMRDRCTTAHEYLFLLTKQPRYFCDMEAIKERAVSRPHAPGNKKLDASRNDKDSMTKTWGADGMANKRSVWRISARGRKDAHFAVMPEELVVNCIKAGTSEKGCCPRCGAPNTRIVERVREATRPGKDTKVTGTESAVHGNRDPDRHVTSTRTIGWEQSCKCKKREPVPCVVLDCFLGSGTVGAVAVSMNRKFIGTELNPEYVAMSERRIKGAIAQKGFGFR